MKTLFIILFLACSFNVKADFITGVAVGSLLGSTTVVNQDEFSKQVAVMERQLPYSANAESMFAEQVFFVDSKDSAKYEAYFKNKGFKVKVYENQIIFDFKSNHERYLKSRAEWQEKRKKAKPYFNTFLWIVGIIFVVTVITKIITDFFSVYTTKSHWVESLLLALIKVVEKNIRR